VVAAVVAVVTAVGVAVGGQIMAGGPARAVSQAGRQCPCSVFPADSTPGTADAGDPYAVVLGVKVVPSADGRIQGVRFYKSSANTGTHNGSLWSSDGRLLGTGTFAGETATGWQTLMFSTPVPVRAGATYVASYYAPNGHYAYDTGYFLNGPAGGAPITALSDTSGGGNGVYSYAGATAFPHYAYNAVNYWVDVVFDDTDVPTGPPTVVDTTPDAGATKASATAGVSATFSAPVEAASVRFSVSDGGGAQVPGVVGYDAAGTTATFTPNTQLAPGAVYTASVQAADAWGHAMSGPDRWSFTVDAVPPAYACPCSLFGGGATPTVSNSNDPNSVELGVRFTPAVNGVVSGVRFYKGALNTGAHTGTLWSGNGSRLATGGFTAETAGGWQTMTFATPVAVTGGTTYVASYHAPVGNYSYTAGYLSYAHRSYPLTAPANISGGQGNGSYAYGATSTFPGDTGNGTSYWVDVVFSAS
jgi:methionine-rich copper-binding protein CopC